MIRKVFKNSKVFLAALFSLLEQFPVAPGLQRAGPLNLSACFPAVQLVLPAQPSLPCGPHALL